MSSYFFLTLDTSRTDNDIVFRFLNRLYSENITMNEIAETARNEINLAQINLETTFLNNFISPANMDGVQNYENILNIIPDASLESLEFRKSRIINRLAMSPPFTKHFLEQMLSIIFGPENFYFRIDYDNCSIYIDIETQISMLYDQTLNDIRQMIPANMKLISIMLVPFTHKYLNRHYTHDEMKQFTFGELSQYN